MNVRHRLWGHLFGGRYKAILVEPGECFSVLLDYIHLNPVRAGLVDRNHGLESYRWSSLSDYILPAKKRPAWFEASLGLSVNGCADTASGRRLFLELLEELIDWEDPENAGVEGGIGAGKLAHGVNVRRGWFFGSQEFGEEIQKRYSDLLRAKNKRREDGYTGGELRDHGERYAKALVEAGLEYFGMEAQELSGTKYNDWRKGVIAERIQAQTTMKLDWIRGELHMGGRSNCARTIRQIRAELPANRKWSAAGRKIQKSAENHD
jgi:putative transposase